MRKADISVHGRPAGVLEEIKPGGDYRFLYYPGYEGPPVSLTMSVSLEPYMYDRFPPFFEGLLPEGYNLEALLRTCKIDRDDLFSQLIAVGMDMVGAVTAQEIR